MANNPRQVLIVEDDDLISQMYQASLAGANFSVQIYPDGEAGWEAIKNTTPDLIILDIMLPKLNGLSLLARIRADVRLSQVPVVMLSSLASATDKQRALTAGATQYWVKNEVNMVEFQQKITQLIK